MMTLEQQLKIQAYVDGELSRAEAKKVEALIAADPEARGLYEELKFAATVLREHEPEFKMPVSQELFWNRIYEQIKQSEPEPIPVLDYLKYLVGVVFSRKNWVPVTATFIASVGIFLLKDVIKPIEDYLVVVETPSDEVGSYSFRAQSEKMFVLWIYNKENVGGEGATKVEPTNIEDEILMQ